MEKKSGQNTPPKTVKRLHKRWGQDCSDWMFERLKSIVCSKNI